MDKAMQWESSQDAIAGVSLHQLAAAADPGRSIRELAEGTEAEESPKHAGASGRPRVRKSRGPGSFQDFDLLFDQLRNAPPIELGKPPPKDRHLPKPRIGSCPASHNRALLGAAGLKEVRRGPGASNGDDD